MNHERLQLTRSWDQENEIIQMHIEQLWTPGRQLQIFEAGCGQKWPLDLSNVEFILTGLDLDKRALELRLNNTKDLHKAIVGDLRTAKFEDATFDVIFSSFVLEHISGAEAVLNNFIKWLRPGGIIVLRIPDPDSVQGFITKITPHWFHVLYYRHVLKLRDAGRPGFGPYSVFYDQVIRRSGIAEFCKRNGLSILVEYGDGYIKPGIGAVRLLISAFKAMLGLLSLGHFSHRHTNLLYIIQKQDALEQS